MNTPKLSQHARDRCLEMGIPTRRAKRVVQHQTTTYPNSAGHNNGGLIVQSSRDPEIAVVWDPSTNVILTVVPRIQEDYIRLSDGYGILP